jgi:hypothetical protein
LYRVTPDDLQHKLLAAWEYEEGVDFFRLTAANRKSVVLIAPERQRDFEVFLSSNNIDNDVLSEDYEVELENERVSMTKNREIKQGFSASNGLADFSIYWTYDEMEAYCTFLASTYPQFVAMETLTFSPEGRRIYAMKVSSGVFGQKPIIGMETGMHAREWVAFYHFNFIVLMIKSYKILSIGSTAINALLFAQTPRRSSHEKRVTSTCRLANCSNAKS